MNKIFSNCFVKIIWVIAIISSASCSHDKSSEVETIQITGQSVRMPDDFMGIFPMFIKGDTIFHLSFSPDYAICRQVICPDSLYGSEDLIKRGSGPGEIDFPVIGFDENGWYIVDISFGRLNRIYKVPFKKDILVHPQEWSEYPLDKVSGTRSSSRSVIPVAGEGMVFLGGSYDNPTSILSRLNYKECTLTPLGLWPDDGIDVNPVVKLGIYTDDATLFSNGETYVYTASYIPQMYMFRINGDTAEITEVLHEGTIDYGSTDDGSDYRPTPSSVVYTTWANDSNIYTLIKKYDANGEVNKSQRPQYGSVVEVYDWDGNLLRNLELDHSGFNIVIPETNDFLYLYGMNQETGEREIWSYDLRKSPE